MFKISNILEIQLIHLTETGFKSNSCPCVRFVYEQFQTCDIKNNKYITKYHQIAKEINTSSHLRFSG